MLDRNCLTWTNLSEFVTFYKICQCSGALDNFIHCGNPPSQVPTEAKYCPDSGGWWVVGVPSVYTADLSSPPHVPASSVGPLGPRGGGNMSLIFWWGKGLRFMTDGSLGFSI